MSRIAIITARGGSKRIPGKNIKNFCGKPIIAYSIEAALESKVFDEVMVSTDSEQIAEIAQNYGAKVPFMRSEQTAGDYATTDDVLLEVFDEYQKRGQTFDIAVCIYPTAPFVTAEKLARCVELLEETNADTVMPVVRYSFPPQRCLVADKAAAMNQVVTADEFAAMDETAADTVTMHYKWPEQYSSRSQDLEPYYHECGQFYGYRVDKYIEKKGLFLTDVATIEVSELEVQDIDNMDDWRLAELKYQLLLQRGINL